MMLGIDFDDELVFEKIAKIKNEFKTMSRRRDRRRRSNRSPYSHRSTSRDRSGSPPSGVKSSLPIMAEQDIIDLGSVEDDIPKPDTILAAALGNESTMEGRYGREINGVLSSRWNHILLKDSVGIKDIEKLYKIPSNCILLEAPELNPEVKVAVTDSALKRDNKLQEKQQQLGIALSCLGLAMSRITKGQNESEVLKLLGDASKLLASLHFQETNTRKQLLAPLLDKAFLKMTETTTRSQYLYGDNLAEKIKSNEQLDKLGFQVQKPKPTPTISRLRNSTDALPIQHRNTKHVGRKNQLMINNQLPKRSPKPHQKRDYPPANHPMRSYQDAQRQCW